MSYVFRFRPQRMLASPDAVRQDCNSSYITGRRNPRSWYQLYRGPDGKPMEVLQVAFTR